MGNNNDKTAAIRQLNDDFRRIPAGAGVPGKVVMTRGIADFSPEDQQNIFSRVRCFEDFTEDNDPYGEHDFGAFDYQGQKIFWKIDYYAPDMQRGSADPADLKKTVRVLTVMLASEY